MVPSEADPTRAIALGDVDGDGDLDALIGNEGEPSRLLRNDGSGDFTDAPSPFTAIPDTTRGAALGDVDGDGDLDAFLANSGEYRLYLNGGAGVFTYAPFQLPAIPGPATSVALGDVDGDGDLDAFLGISSGGGLSIPLEQNRLYLNDGSGVFADATAQVPPLFSHTQSVALGDVDGDGDLDALIGNSNAASALGATDRLYLNNGTGAFADAPYALPPVPPLTTAIALGDVDGDGDLDAVFGRSGYFPQADLLLLNGGSGLFADATSQLPAVLGQSTAVALADVDGDADLDALIGDYEGSNRLYRNDGAGVFADATAEIPATLDETRAVAPGDVDGDGDLDALIGVYEGPNRLFLNDGSGGFSDATGQVPSVPDDTYAIALGDVDGDGDLDVLSGNVPYPPEQDRLSLNDGAAGFTDASSQLPAILGYTQAVATGDVDGDGDLDALLVNYGQADFLFLNAGMGAFANAPSQLPAIVAQSTSVSLGDVEGDGDLDAWIGNHGQNRLYLNNGSGGFTDATSQIPAHLESTRAIAVGDVDADGDLDALIGNGYSSAQPDRLYVNDGGGSFADATSQLPAILGFTQALALGDVDGDGDPDALIGNYEEPTRLYLNDGSGLFADAPAQLPVNVDPTVALALGDVDGDGDPDALIGNYEEPARLYVNDGSGLFADATPELPATVADARAVALGDLDGDGDLDVWIGDEGSDRLLLNLTRQLAWRGLPRTGKPLTLDLYGPPSGSWILAWSVGPASVPIPPFGTLRLNPLFLYLSGAGSLDAQGRASIPFAVPQSPALVGASLYWQAVVGAPFALTNLEITTATNL